MAMVNMLEAKSSLSKLVEAVESGAESEIIIARNGKPAAKLVAIDQPKKGKRKLGMFEGEYPPFTLEEWNSTDAEIAKMFGVDELRLLLDTHVAIWALTQRTLIPSRVVSVLQDDEASIFVSVVVIWEIAIKSSLRRVSAPQVEAARIAQMCSDAAYEILPVTTRHALAVTSLPHLHADPFDRLMIAQAKVEPMRLVTHDKVMAAYDQNFISW